MQGDRLLEAAREEILNRRKEAAGRGRVDPLAGAARRPAGAAAHRHRAHRSPGPSRARRRARRGEGLAGRAGGRGHPHRGGEGRGGAAVDGRARDVALARRGRRGRARAARSGTRVRGVAHPAPGRRAAGVPHAAQPGRRARRADHPGRERAGGRRRSSTPSAWAPRPTTSTGSCVRRPSRSRPTRTCAPASSSSARA